MPIPPVEIEPANVKLHAFDDIPHWRQDIFDKTLSSLEASFPREYGNVKLELNDLNYNMKQVTPDDEKDARMKKKKLMVPVKGTVTLRDTLTNEVLDRVKNKTVLSVPYLTDRGTFEHNGSNYTSMRQARLLPGAYSRRKQNGQLEVHYNVKPGSGRTFRVTFDPEKALFRMEIGGSNLKLYSVLKALGVEDDTLRKSWGDDIYATNAAAFDKRDANKLFSKLYPFDQETTDETERFQKIREAIQGNIVLESTMQNTLGKFEKRSNSRADVADRIRRLIKSSAAPLIRKVGLEDPDEQHLEIDDIIRGSYKLLAINRGEAKPDDRDALQYKRIYSTGDLIGERVKIDANKTARTLMRKLAKRRSLEYLPGNFLNNYTEGQLVGNQLSSPGEETNPILLYDQLFRITQMGPGGIGSDSAVTESMQNVNPSEFGFLDPIAGPESGRAGVDVRATHNSRLGSDGRIYQKFFNPRLKRYEWLNARDLQGKALAFKD